MTLQQTFTWRCRVRLARWHQAIGWPGWAGVALMVAAVAFAWQSALSTQLEAEAVVAQAVPPDTPTAASAPAVSVPALPSLASADEVSAVVADVQRRAVEAGAGWPAAEYKLVPASDGEAQRLEIRCDLKSTYPQLRALLSGLMRDVPGLTLRDLSISRASVDVPDVESRLTIVVFLRDRAAVAAGTVPEVRR